MRRLKILLVVGTNPDGFDGMRADRVRRRNLKATGGEQSTDAVAELTRIKCCAASVTIISRPPSFAMEGTKSPVMDAIGGTRAHNVRTIPCQQPSRNGGVIKQGDPHTCERHGSSTSTLRFAVGSCPETPW